MNARALAILLLIPSVGVASDLAVQGANTNTGAFAARVGANSTCTLALHATVTGSLNGGTFEGCTTLSSDADVASGSVLLRAGNTVALQSGFSVAAGASLTVEIDSSIFPDAYVQDDTPEGELIYAARFYVDGTQLLTNGTNRFYHFEALGAQNAPVLRVGTKWNAGNTERRLFVEGYENDGTFETTEGVTELVLQTGWHWVEAGWRAASAPGASDGTLYLCIDSLVFCSGFSNLDTDLGTVERVRWGALDVPLGDFGTIDMDDFASVRSLLIGALP